MAAEPELRQRNIYDFNMWMLHIERVYVGCQREINEDQNEAHRETSGPTVTAIVDTSNVSKEEKTY